MDKTQACVNALLQTSLVVACFVILRTYENHLITVDVHNALLICYVGALRDFT